MITFTIISELYLVYKTLTEILVDEYGNVKVIEKIDFDDLNKQFAYSGKKVLIVDWIVLEKFSNYLSNQHENVVILPILSDKNHSGRYKQFESLIYLDDDRRIISNKIAKSITSITKTDIPLESNKDLSKRETLILSLVAQGLTTRMIADKLHISPLTVSSHRKNIGTKLGIKTNSALTTYAILNGLIDIHNTK